MAIEYQKELFNEFNKEKGRIEKIADKITQRKKRLYLNLPIENIIFAVIIVIMAVIVSFALGVERGKVIARPVGIEENTLNNEEVVSVKKVGQFTEIELGPITVMKTAAIEAEKIVPAREERPIPDRAADTQYTIQLISYKKKDLADREQWALKAKGLDTSIISSGNWYKVCVGTYGNMDRAKEALKEFAGEYKGCFIRRK
ncbi:MAG: SPOR domain-containing protein [Candidatus Omnitrophota bacterium]